MSNYSNYNYYSNKNKVSNIRIPYSPKFPSTKYRNKKPQLKDFNLENVDLKKLQNQHNQFEEKKQKLESYIVLLVIVGFFVVPIAGVNGDGLFFLVLIVFIIIGTVINSKKNEMKFEYQKEYDNYIEYQNAMQNYEFWQNRKEESFWFGLSGREFEKEVCKIFNSIGYKAYLCKQGGDGGVDIDLYDINGEHSIVQCKAHNKKISPGVARDLYGTMVSKKVKKGYLVTLVGGTEGTIDFCRKNSIIIWDVYDLVRRTKNK